jgi:hypothetical protein
MIHAPYALVTRYALLLKKSVSLFSSIRSSPHFSTKYRGTTLDGSGLGSHALTNQALMNQALMNQALMNHILETR